MARLSKADELTLQEFELVFEDVPEVDNSRHSKWDAYWEAAVELCRRHPGKSLRVRTFNNASTAYKEAKEINNGEFRGVPLAEDEDLNAWTAIAVKTPETYVDKKERSQHIYAIYLKFNAPTDSEE